MFSIYTILCIILVCFSVFFKKLKHEIRKKYFARNIVSPKGWPLLGHANLFLTAKPEEIIPIIEDVSKECGKTFKLTFGTELYIFILDTKDIEYVLGTNNLMEKAHEYNLLNDWLCEGLLISKPQKWYKRRKMLTPAFHFAILEQFIEVFERNSRILVNNLQKELDNQEDIINIEKWINLVTLDIICESTMGVSIHAQTTVDSKYVKAVKTISNIIYKRLFDISYHIDIIYRFTSLALEEKKALAILHGFSEEIIAQRREELLKTMNNSEESQSSDDVGSKRKMAFLDILLQSEIDGKPLSNLDIREEVDTFMFEGHDTTAAAINFFLYNLSVHPECQQKCFEEILQVFGTDKTSPVTYKGLSNLHYMELCIKESLRMYPSVHFMGRKVTEDCNINGKIFPAGATVVISNYHLGRQEDVFPDAETFKPERFEKNHNTDKMSPYAYVPFSAGSRNCIGQKFAMLKLKTIIVNILRHYEIDFVGDRNKKPAVVAEIVLKFKDPLKLSIKPRVY